MNKKIALKKLYQTNTGVLFLIFILIFIFMSILSPTTFFTFYNLQSMAYQLPELGLFTLSMMLVIMTGGINLSITFSATMGMIVGGIFMSNYWNNGQGSAFIAIVGAIIIMLLIAAFCGFFNGYICAIFGVAPMIATLGTSTLYEGICLNLTKGGAISGFPNGFIDIGNSTFLGIPIPMIVFIIVAIIMYFLLEKSKLGVSIRMVGCSPTVSKFSGINVKKVLIETYLIGGVLAGLAGILMASRYNSSKADYGSSYVLQAVAASVLGGTDIMGGYGTVIGTVIAVGILQIISSGLNIFGLNSYLTTVIIGFVMIAVLTINYFMSLRKGNN